MVAETGGKGNVGKPHGKTCGPSNNADRATRRSRDRERLQKKARSKRVSAIVSHSVRGTLACRFTDCLRVAEVALTFAFRELSVTTSVKNSTQFFRELQKACRGLSLPGFVGGDVLCVRPSQGP
jgi:hypothetical protein